MYCRDADPGTWPKNLCNLMAHFILKILQCSPKGGGLRLKKR